MRRRLAEQLRQQQKKEGAETLPSAFVEPKKRGKRGNLRRTANKHS
jgi:hypothetical protein